MLNSKLLKIKNNIRLSQLSLIGGGLALLMLSPSAAANDCTYRKSSAINSNVQNLQSFKQGGYEPAIVTFDINIYCHSASSYPTVVFELTSDTPSIPNSPDIYPTNLRGIGIKFRSNLISASSCRNGTPIQGITPSRFDFYCNYRNSTNIHRNDSIHLVKLNDNYDVGTIDIPTILKVRYRGESSYSAQYKTLDNVFQATGSVTIVRNSCTLDSNRLDFNLGKNQQNDFKGIGSIGNSITKKISLTCDPDTHYSLKVNGVQEGNHPGVIKLTSEAGVATGVGVQLLADGQPVEFGKAKQMGTSAPSGNDIKATIDITAQYYQTAPSVTAGPANASATFTMTYQ
ncbi:putative fimbrial subunit [Yersinia massiliensis]|uniref:fimbrial protein n=1 Tax=Yersinia massiliensis TaxID=419257 RepID=UPI0005DC4B4C|nr:fimbrial protein [Yersinia massiliensis]CNI08506.1 putative fimbrial subunit [Yersinia massiliensis]